MNVLNLKPVPVSDCHVEWYVNGGKRGKKNKRIIDVCRFGSESEVCVYEVMFLTGEGEQLAMERTNDWQDAHVLYARMVYRNCPVEWKKLIADLTDADLAAMTIPENEDGGTCNFDSPALELPSGMTFEQVQACCAAAGFHCFRWKPSGKTYAVLCVKSPGQGNQHTRGAEAACKLLAERGYNVTMYYQMD